MNVKRGIAATLAATMVAGLVGCSGGGNQGSSTNKDGEKVLTIPTYWTGENVGAVYFEPAVERFNEKYQGQYEVVIEEVVEASYIEKMTQLAQTGKLPALLTSPTTEFINTIVIPNDMYVPMNDFLAEHPEIEALCIDSSVEYCTQENGDIVSVPVVSLAAMGSFYNTDLYNPDKNIVDMSVDEFAESLGDNKCAFQTVDNAWTSMLLLSALIANEEGGAEWLIENDGGKVTDFTADYVVNAVTKLQDIWTSNAASNSIGAAYADAANAFMSNEAGVIFNGAWMNSEFGETGMENWSNDFDGAKVKADYFPGNVALCNTKSYGRYVLTNNGTEDEKEVAEAFLAFIYSQDELETFALTEGVQIPNMEYSEEFLNGLNSDPLIKAQTELITEDTVIVPTIASIMYDSIANQVFATELVQLVNGTITPEQFCQNLTDKSVEAAE